MKTLTRVFPVCRSLAVVIALGLVPASAVCQERSNVRPQVKPDLDLTVDKVLEWLPADTETIMVDRGPYKIEPPPREDQAAPPPLEVILRYLSLGPLVQRKATPKKELADEVVLFTVEGSKGFRSPKGLGLMPYDGCHVVVFNRDVFASASACLKSMKDDGAKEMDVAGHKAVVWEEQMERDQWAYYVVHARPNVMLVATDKKSLEEVLKRMEKKAPNRALPANLPEWKWVDTKAQFWAIRHYDKANADKDPSTPLTNQKRAANHPDLDAIGLTFSYDPGKEKSAKVRYLSASKDATLIVAGGWTHTGEGLTPKIRMLEKGVVEITAELNNARTIQIYMLVLLGHLGHGIYL